MLSSLMCAVGLAACCGLCCLKDQPQIKAAYYQGHVGTESVYDSSAINVDFDTGVSYLIVSYDVSNDTYDFYETYNYSSSTYESYIDNVWQGSSVADSIRDIYPDMSDTWINAFGDYSGGDIFLMYAFRDSTFLGGSYSYVDVSFGMRKGYLNNFGKGCYVYFDMFLADVNKQFDSLTYIYHYNPYIYNFVGSEFNSNIYDSDVYSYDNSNGLTNMTLWLSDFGAGYDDHTTPYLSGVSHTSYSFEYGCVPFSPVVIDSGITNYGYYQFSGSNDFVWNNYSMRFRFNGSLKGSVHNDNSFNVAVFSASGSYGSNSFENAWYNGYDKGYSEGYTDGYRNGQSLSSNSWTRLFGAVADTPITMLRGLFDFDLFGMNVLAVVLSLLSGILVINLVRKFI